MQARVGYGQISKYDAGQIPELAKHKCDYEVKSEDYRFALIRLKQLPLKFGESLQIRIQDHEDRQISKDHSDCRQLIEYLLKAMPNLKYLRIMIRHSFYDFSYQSFAFALNEFQKLSIIIIISEIIDTAQTSPQQELLWKSFLKVAPTVEKWAMISRVTLKQGEESIDPNILGKMEKCQYIYGCYYTSIERQNLRELQKVKQWLCSTLKLQYNKLRPNQFPNPLKEIKNIEFWQLRHLILRNNQLITIESISRLNAPVLEGINLEYNWIVSIGPLIKLHSNKIQYLTLSTNQINDGDALIMANMRKLKNIWIVSPKNRNHIQSLKTLIKVEMQSVVVYGGCPKRINEKIVRQCGKKSQKLEIKT